MTANEPHLRRRTLAGVATAGLGLPVLAACGGDSSTATDRRTPSSAASASASDSPSASATASAGESATPSASESASESASKSAGADAFASTSDVAVGGGTIFPDAQLVITQPDKGEFRCFTAVCTHQGCIVSSVSDGLINCGCHGSAFSIADGSVVNGPATQPLGEEQISVKGDSITLG